MLDELDEGPPNEYLKAVTHMEEVPLGELIQQVGLDPENSYLWPGSAESIVRSQPLDPDQFVRFAKQDLTDGGIRGRVNALSNAKRAMDCQAATALRAIGIGDPSGPVPAKLELLEKIGFIAPSLLRQANRHRNELEHDYRLPEETEVRQALEIAELFVEAMRRTLWVFPTEFWIGSGPEIETFAGLRDPKHALLVKFAYDDHRFDIEGALDGLPVNRARVGTSQRGAYRALVEAAIALQRPHQDGRFAVLALADALRVD